MKVRMSLLVPVLMMLIVWAGVAQADGRILFAGDRDVSSDLDIWKTNESGTYF